MANAQDVDVVKTSNRTDLTPAKDFAFIEPSTDTTTYGFVATYTATGRKKQANITNLFYKIAVKAKKDGANCFKLNDYHYNDSANELMLTLDTYYWNDSIRVVNFEHHEKNGIYIFGGERVNDDNTLTFKVDDEKKTIPSGTYYKLARIDGKEVKISKGGFSGMTMWLGKKGEEPTVFFTMTGLGLGGGPMPAGVIGMSFNTGRIQKVPGDLGHLLTMILKPANKD
jgi:hypothetical protein